MLVMGDVWMNLFYWGNLYSIKYYNNHLNYNLLCRPEYKTFPVKLTDPVTGILYVTFDKKHMEDLKHTIHVKEVSEGKIVVFLIYYLINYILNDIFWNYNIILFCSSCT